MNRVCLEKEKKGHGQGHGCRRSLQVWEALESLVLGDLGEEQREPDRQGPRGPFLGVCSLLF